MRYLLKLAFLGTDFHGWQSQKNARTVQDVLNAALSDLFGEKISAVGCSRTDAGVHAEEFFAHFDAEKAFPAERLPAALAERLPKSVSVLEGRVCDPAFHARYDAVGKIYRYEIRLSPVRDPFWEGRALFLRRAPDAARMHREAQAFLGTHDFSSFRAAGSEVEDPVRRIDSFEVKEHDGRVTMTVRGNGFLYHMVRIMAGTLLDRDAGKDLLPIPEILEKRDRTYAGITAKACGLYLQKVFYE